MKYYTPWRTKPLITRNCYTVYYRYNCYIFNVNNIDYPTKNPEYLILDSNEGIIPKNAGVFSKPIIWYYMGIF